MSAIKNPAESCLIVKLNLSCWDGRILDTSASKEVERNKDAHAGTAKVNKVLLPGGTGSELATLQSCHNEARKWHYANTLPWLGKGEQLISQLHFFSYKEKMSEYEGKCERALNLFLDAYPQRVKEAAVPLGRLYNVDDYPSAADLRARYRFKVVPFPVPQANQLVNMVGVDLAAETEREISEAFKGAMSDAYDRLLKVVSHAHERLSTPDAVFRDSLIENMKELRDVLPRLNVLGDPKLDEVLADLDASLKGRSPNALREDKYERQAAAQDYKVLLDKIKSYSL